MIVGVPSEIKPDEYRVAITPAGVRELSARGHEVLVQRGAGEGSAMTDEQFRAQGARIVADAETVFGEAELVLKVKEPQPEEIGKLREGQTLFTYLHLAAEPELAHELMASGATCIAYETVEDSAGRLPLLAPMSEVAGKIATQAGAFMLEKPLGGRGILLGGVPGVAAATVLVIGGGVVGMNAAFIAIGMQADVFVFDRSIDRLRELEVAFAGRASTVYSSTLAIEEMLPLADLVIGAVLVHGGRAPHVVTREQLKLMRPHAVLVDVSIDQGGCFETSRPTTHSDPTYEVDGITHYCVTNMPGAVPITSTYALTNATLPYALALADNGPQRAMVADPGLRSGVERARWRDHAPRRSQSPTAGGGPDVSTQTETLSNFIDGERVAAEGESEPILNPATGEELARASKSTAQDVDRAVQAARSAFGKWSTTTPAQRAQALLALADLIDEHAPEIARLEALNAGKPIEAVTGDELPVMADNLRFFAGAARCLEGRAAGEYMEGYTSFTRREAVGVIGQITPWNYPLMMAIWKIGPALAAGNTIVLKPAETTPITTIRLAELAADVLPAGVLNVVTGHGQPTGQALISHPEVDMVSLTGSVDTGKHIARTAAETLKRVHLELGGKAPVVVFDDVALESALETIAGTGYYNAGQDCTAATRVLAGAKVYDDVVAGLAEQAQGLVIGDTLAPETTLGPVNSARQRERVEGFLERRPAARGDRHRRSRARAAGVLRGADRRRRVGTGGRDDPARDLRPGHHRAALLRREAGDRVGEQHALRPGLLGVDPRRRPRAARLARVALRVRVDQRPHPARLRDAPRGVQGVGVRQGPERVLAGGLHGRQARDGLAPVGRWHGAWRRPQSLAYVVRHAPCVLTD